MWPDRIGRSSPTVISVCPPTSVICSSWHACLIWPKISSHQPSVVPCSGKRRVARNQRGAAHGGDIVGIDGHGIVANSVRRSSNGVGLGDQEAVAHVNHRGVFADTGSNHQAWVCAGNSPRRAAAVLAGVSPATVAWSSCGRFPTLQVWQQVCGAGQHDRRLAPETVPRRFSGEHPHRKHAEGLAAWISRTPSPTIIVRLVQLPRRVSAVCKCPGCGLTWVT